MKKYFSILASVMICLGLLPAYSQPGPPGGGPSLGGPISKLFGDNQNFSAAMEMQVTDKDGKPISLPGKISYDTGKSRFELNLTDIKGGNLPPNAAAQMKTMGLDEMITIALPDKKTVYLIYPGLQSYAELPMPKSDSATTNSDYKMEATEIGKETIDGHPCVKNKVIVTDKEGAKHESTVWNATDLKQFPVKIQTADSGDEVIMLFKNISLAKPAASSFETPSSYTKYDNVQTLMQQQVMKRMGAGMMGGTPGSGAAVPPAMPPNHP
ncbi:MAG: DUF4412 domain-containing protein [Verrucomicrobiia bacterium]